VFDSNKEEEKDSGYVKFSFNGSEGDPEFLIETCFPKGLSVNETIDFMAQMLFYVHSGNLTEQNASAVLQNCSEAGQYELGARIIQRWHQYEESNSYSPSSSEPCVSPSSLFPRKNL
jgi:hypothetical protein